MPQLCCLFKPIIILGRIAKVNFPFFIPFSGCAERLAGSREKNSFQDLSVTRPPPQHSPSGKPIV